MIEGLREGIRPLTVAALVIGLLLGAVISGTLEVFHPGAGVSFTKGLAGFFRAIPGDYYNLATLALLGYTAGRTVEKAIGIHSTAKHNPPARPVDDPGD
ncbi:hypothetical protein K3172_12850 [Qipengyuania sp. 6B39]|uniref:hypothetical protein n=1 Tax=Qipengyuania proteolytica TaxID=2867239 RepID=UPI001C895DD5|nr:hypothetical protein [Qipengyuania proteolytica]MBX7496747.1 hypothetical protein [Qipengyuania proteolytica]